MSFEKDKYVKGGGIPNISRLPKSHHNDIRKWQTTSTITQQQGKSILLTKHFISYFLYKTVAFLFKPIIMQVFGEQYCSKAKRDNSVFSFCELGKLATI